MATHTHVNRFSARRLHASGLFYVILTLILIGCGSNLSGEPEIVATIAPTQPPAPHAIPAPIIQQGAQLFANRCSSCHGLNGQGDGELVQSGQIPFMGDFTQVDATDGQTLQDWFRIITEGNINNGMPPWSDALTPEERWAVTLFSYTLPYTSMQISTGETLVADNPTLNTLLTPFMDDQFVLLNTSDDALREFITTNGTFSESDQQAIIAYARAQAINGLDTASLPLNVASNTVAQPSPPPPVITEEVASDNTIESTQAQVDPTPIDLPLVSMSGTITNGTAGSELPIGLEVTLRIFDELINETTLTTTINADGNFTFNDVPLNTDWVYFATVEFQGERFGVQADPNTPETPLAMTIYEITNDPSVITLVGEVVQINNVNNTLEILHAFQYRNDSDKLFVSGQNEDGNTTSLVVTLPVGAIIVRTDNDQRYIIPDDNSGLVDTSGVFPGNQHFISVVYLLPYFGDATIDYPTTYQFDGPIRFLISDPAIELSGDLYERLEDQPLGEVNYEVYGTNLSLQAGDSIRYTLEGGGIETTSSDSDVVTSNNLIPIIGIFLIAVGAMGAFLLYLNRNSVQTSTSNRDRLIDGLVSQIAELDAQHDAGDINHDLYHQRRKQLQSRLDALMDGTVDPDVSEEE